MDINYHYFMIKTLAYAAGFSQEDAQTIAYYSQQVDDFIRCSPMRVSRKPPAYFIEKGYAKEVKGVWQVMPHPTGIDMAQSLEKHYRRATLSPFHFITAKPLAELETDPGFTRADYRCVRADDVRAGLINQIMEEAVEAVREEICEKSLMQLGMAIHIYSDTYAHYGYSGMDGWENRALIKKAYNQQTRKEEVSAGERLAYRALPPIGHGNAGHVPDICTYKIDIAMRKDERDDAYTLHIVRNNRKDFLNCAKALMGYLCRAAQKDEIDKMRWFALKVRLSSAMQITTGDETDKKKLISQWGWVFPRISYAYDENERFYLKSSTADVDIAEAGMPANMAELEWSEFWDDMEMLAGINVPSIKIYHVTEAFYLYNELAYRLAERILGTAEALQQNAQMLDEVWEADQPIKQMSPKDEQGTIEATSVDIETSVNPAMPVDSGMSADLAGSDGVKNWEPQSELGYTVYAAGFTYQPEQDIIYSTMNNVQRTGGYCKGYDNAAIAINSVIDSEPIYFSYDGYEWLIELWKGQYGIETGGEIGVYYRKENKPRSILEKTVLGNWYDSVPDDRMLDMRFTLNKGTEVLLERDWTRHWWLTGFHWGIFSEPEQLTMAAAIYFPNREMQQAFIRQGLEPLGYSYTEPDDYSVDFTFDTPMTSQPVIRNRMRKSVQRMNLDLVKTYNTFRAKYEITNNDPNVISRVINEQPGIAEKKFYEKLVRYYNRKSAQKEELRSQTL